MALLMNNSVFLNSTTSSRAAAQGVLMQAFNTQACHNRFYGEVQIAGEFEKSSLPNGYTPPYTWMLAPKAGGLGCNVGVAGTASVSSGNLAAGKNLETSIGCTGDLFADCGLIVSLVASILTSGQITDAVLAGKLELAAGLAGSGDLTGSLVAIGHILASLSGSVSLSPEMNALANMTADITPFTELSPENLANAVWAVQTSTLTDAGTTGKTLVDTEIKADDALVFTIAK